MSTKFSLISIILTLVLFSISCEKEVSTSPPVEPVPIGFLYLESNPPGAKIYEDGRFSGRYTPDSLNWLEEKVYNFTLKKELYRDTSFTVEIVEGEKKNIYIDYLQNPKMMGRISFTSSPEGADITINGSDLGAKTPYLVNDMVPGDYIIVYKRENCRTDSMHIQVLSNYTYDAHLDLIDTTYWVDYNVQTSGILDNYINSIAIDKNDKVWVGTTQGLSSFDGTEWQDYGSWNSLILDNYISIVRVDETNKKWIGTLGGMCSFDDMNWKRYGSLLPSDYIEDITFDVDGKVIVATQLGIAKESSREWTTFVEEMQGTYWTTGVTVDNNGVLWITTKNYGIFFFDGETWDGRFHIFSGLHPDVFYNCVAASRDAVWFGHFPNPDVGAVVGLSSVRGTFFNFGFREFNGIVIHNIGVDEYDRKWLCTDEGLYTFIDYSDRTIYRMSNTPIKTNKIRDVAFDSQGRVWVATWGAGIYKFKRELP